MRKENIYDFKGSQAVPVVLVKIHRNGEKNATM
jgi:hypothetical protein